MPPESAPARPPSDEGEIRPEPKAVWVLRNGKPERVRVRTGLTDGTVTEILEGELREGDEVITEASGGDGAAPASTNNRAPTQGAPRMRL